MTEKDDPSRVAFGGNGHGGPDLPRRTHTGNGANGNGTLAERKLAFLDSTSDAARSSKLGQLILDTLDRGVIATHLLSALASGAFLATGFGAHLPAPNSGRPRRILVSPPCHLQRVAQTSLCW